MPPCLSCAVPADPDRPCPDPPAADLATATRGPALPVRPPAPETAMAAEAGGTMEPSPGGSVDLARLLVPDPEHTVLLRVCGDSMQGAGIRHGDLLVVERRRPARPGAIVIARLGGCFTVKRLQLQRGRRWLEAAHPAYPPLDLEVTARQQGLDGAEVGLWGVAVHVIHTL